MGGGERAGVKATWRWAFGLVLILEVGGCGHAERVGPGGLGGDNGGIVTYTNLRVYDSPYLAVDWASDVALKSQFHDHIGIRPERLLAYDRAGYQVVALMDYSGRPSADFSWRERIWPPEEFISAEVLAQLENIQFLIPGAEEIGLGSHVISPFLTTYLEIAPAAGGGREFWQYTSLQDLLGLVRSFGGTPCVAHPWNLDVDSYAGRTSCVEVYSGYAEAMRHQGREEYVAVDRNAVLLGKWNEILSVDQYVIGIAVNDHTGPYLSTDVIPPRIRDSGKVIVMAREAEPAAFREAFERGAIISVRDMGEIKDQYPRVLDITVGSSSVIVSVDRGRVVWVGREGVILEGEELPFSSLPRGTRWIRPEVRADDGSVLYLQAFVVRPVGDVDGDYDVDRFDSDICKNADWNLLPRARRDACSAASPVDVD